MDKQRNIELENWLIETTGEEMMANHLGPNWNRFHEEYGFYPNISMTIADQVWEHKQKRIDELQARVDAALKETQHALRYVEADMRGNHEFLKMAMIRTFKSLAQALKGGEV